MRKRLGQEDWNGVLLNARRAVKGMDVGFSRKRDLEGNE